MARVRTTAKRVWTPADHKQLRECIRQGMTGTASAKYLKRSRGAVYQYASTHGLSFKSAAKLRRRSR